MGTCCATKTNEPTSQPSDFKTTNKGDQQDDEGKTNEVFGPEGGMTERSFILKLTPRNLNLEWKEPPDPGKANLKHQRPEDELGIEAFFCNSFGNIKFPNSYEGQIMPQTRLGFPTEPEEVDFDMSMFVWPAGISSKNMSPLAELADRLPIIIENEFDAFNKQLKSDDRNKKLNFGEHRGNSMSYGGIFGIPNPCEEERTKEMFEYDMICGQK
jgi:hypothetical protein